MEEEEEGEEELPAEVIFDLHPHAPLTMKVARICAASPSSISLIRTFNLPWREEELKGRATKQRDLYAAWCVHTAQVSHRLCKPHLTGGTHTHTHFTRKHQKRRVRRVCVMLRAFPRQDGVQRLKKTQI